MQMRTWIILAALATVPLAASAQQHAATPPAAAAATPSSKPSAVSAPTQADIDQLTSQVVSLRAQLIEANRRLAEEKGLAAPCLAQRARDDLDALRQDIARQSASVRSLLGLPPQDAQPSAPAAPGPPPK